MNQIPVRSDTQSSSHIRIDVSTLREFGAFVRHELDDIMAPMAGQIGRELTQGGDIGANLPSDDLLRMNLEHSSCVSAMKHQLGALTRALAFLSDAAQAISDRYSTSDSLAHTTIANITPEVNAAFAQDHADGNPA